MWTAHLIESEPHPLGPSGAAPARPHELYNVAWRRADEHLGSRGVPLVIEEFAEGFVARPVPGGNGLLVVDRRTGALTRWPDLPTGELAEHYRRYLRGEL
ncbi:hypothetical protein Arub01_04170 [Actinomadura rubrobrunea]|uniref:Uncharacterized protein n=1 Tax=Actinomadura rubrobrunea TaxID=115335 RepID=A0A9W6PSC9_9ACTN|nr:hypothetical protein [Actinomadura rubrobrunea]GLW62173.1 hypothetical protein Arub01_04170 [Actinomadura rubrobrunea]